MEDETDVHEYAKWIGIDPVKEPHLLWIARKGLVAPLPPGWVKTETSTPGEVYYVNEALGDSTWDHPSDEMYRDMVRTERAKAMQASPAASSPRYQGEPTTPARGGPNAQRTYEPGRTRQGPTRQEVEDYARFLGMDPDDPEDQQLMWIAREGLTEPLPKFWRLCHRDSDGSPYYFHVKNGDSQWDHPLDKKYRDMYKEYRQRSRRSGGYDDDSDDAPSRAGSRRGGSRQGSRSGSRRGGSRQGSRSSRYGDDGPAAQLASSGGRTRIGPDGSKMIEVGEILDEHVDVNFMPTEEDVYNYAAELGFDVDGDQHLLWIARNGLRKPMPKEWKAIKSRDNRIYYFNTSTGKSQWEHPIDQECRRIYEQEKFSEGQAAYLQTRLRGDGNLVGPGASQHVQYQQQHASPSSSRGRNKELERQQLAAYGRAGTQPQHNPGGWSHDGSYQRAAYYRNQSDPPHVQAHSNRAPVASRPYDGHGSRSTWSNPTPPPPAYEQPGYKGQPQPYGAPPDPRNPRRGAGEPGAPYRVNNAQPQSSLRGSRSRGGQSSRGWSGESEWESSSSRGQRSRRRRSER